MLRVGRAERRGAENRQSHLRRSPTKQSMGCAKAETETSMIAPGLYQHFKGKQYRVHAMARHSETGESFVVYEPLYESGSKLWVRPEFMFMEKVLNPEGDLVPRFAFVSE
jgi:hypothetical protein